MNIVQKSLFDAVASLGELADKPTSLVVIGNGKTGKSVENRIRQLEGNKMKGGCPLMKAVDGHVTSPKCPSCYAVSLLNNYKGLLESLKGTQSVYDIVHVAAHAHPTIKRKLSGQPIYPGDRLRIYGATDFDASNMPALRMLAKVYKLDIFSKTLWLMPSNRIHLVELARMPGVNIQLSFNKEMNSGSKTYREMIDEVKAFVKAFKIGGSVGLNYTITSDYRKTGRSDLEEIKSIPGIGVYHIVSKDKHKITRAFGGDDSKVCGIFNAAGAKITDLTEEKGSCIGCTYCRDNVLDNVA